MGNAYYPTGGPMRVQARQGSSVERHYSKSSLPSGQWPRPTSIARGITPSLLDDLLYHGGKLVPQMEFQNIYLGSQLDWQARDIEAIDGAITHAMHDTRLNNVMKQYFPGAAVSCDVRASLLLDEAKPKSIDEATVHAKMIELYDAGKLAKRDLSTTIFNLILPSGSLLKLDKDSSLHGLGGYHGSVHFKRNRKIVTLYYSTNVYSEMLPQKKGKPKENGIVAFKQPWKNVVATLYHEINEFRTDPDVSDAIASEEDQYLGWMSRDGSEVGDQPIFMARTMDLVFKEVHSHNKRVPVQFMYSNVVHGAEGPITHPHV
jgi:hypothetical protein